MSSNFVYLEGRVVRSNTVTTTSGKIVSKVTIVLGGGKNKDGTFKDGTFIDVDIWNPKNSFVQALATADETKKPLVLAVKGSLRMDQWKAKDGSNRSKIKVNADSYQLSVPEPKKNEETLEEPRRKQAPKPAAKPARKPAPPVDDEEDLPEDEDVVDLDDDDSPF